MQAPRTSRASLVKGRSQANAVAQQALIAHWQSIVKSLNNFLQLMKANYVRSLGSEMSAICIFYKHRCYNCVFVGTILFSNMVWLYRCPHSQSVKCSLRHSLSSMFSYSTGRCIHHSPLRLSPIAFTLYLLYIAVMGYL